MCQHDASDLNLVIDAKSLKPLFKMETHRHWRALVFDWMIIFAAIILTSQYFNPLTYVLAVVIIGARMHALAILMHDATHYRFLKNRKWNDLLTNLLTMYPIFTSIEGYRQNHLQHHIHLNTEQDPDWVSKLGVREFTFPKTKLEFLKTVFAYFTLYRGMKDVIWYLKRFESMKKKYGAESGQNRVRLLFYVILFVALTIAGLWKYYLLFWVIPYLSTFFMFQYIRSVAEHFGELAYDHLLTSTRSVKANLLERFFIAPHHVGYHLEHHLYPGVPFYNLDKLHELLMKDPSYNGKAHITHGYMSGLLNELGQSALIGSAGGNHKHQVSA